MAKESIVNKHEKTYMKIQYHIRCKPGDVGKYVLLPGDPARVLRFAKYVKDAEKIAYHREFLTYTGYYNGIKVSSTSTGIGCPSAAIAVEELANIGAEVFIRIGSTGAIQEFIEPGDLVIVTGSMKNEGTSDFYVPKGFPAIAHIDVVNALIQAAEELKDKLNFKYHVGIVSTDDAFYGETPEFLEKLRKLNILSLDMESSAIFTVAHLRNLKAGTIMAVSGNLVTGDVVYEKEHERLVEGWDKEIQVALRAIEILEQIKK